jgi:nucleoside-diphosphate-sugar epimerase
MKTCLVLGAGGFIGNHMVNRLKDEGYWVRGVDLKYPEFGHSRADHFVIRDLREQREVEELIGYAGCNRNPYQVYNQKFDVAFDEIYQFAADMGGAGYVFTGMHDADIMHNSVTINLNVLNALVKKEFFNTKVFYSSSACMYPEYNQKNNKFPDCREDTAYPAQPDSEYGWEKLFSERLYLAYNKNHEIPVRIARFHNIYGPLGTWQGGKEKAPAAICRKVIEAPANGSVQVWGDGEQTRSFLYIDDCIDAVRLLMQSDFKGPVNIGSEEMVTINELVDIACGVEGKTPKIDHIPGPQGVRGRTSNNDLIRKELGWEPKVDLREGIVLTYKWIASQHYSNYKKLAVSA